MKKYLIIPLMVFLLLCTGCSKKLKCSSSNYITDAKVSAVFNIGLNNKVKSLELVIEYDASNMSIGYVENKIKRYSTRLQELKDEGIVEKFNIYNKKETFEVKVSGKPTILGEEYEDMIYSEAKEYFEGIGGTCN